MCLAVFAVNALANWPLVIVANRDEYHERPTATLDVWSDRSAILAGRDLRACGTWLGVNRQGRIGLLTNVREPGKNNPSAVSRGQIIENYLVGDDTADLYLAGLASEQNLYNGFNLLLFEQEHAWFMSNRGHLDDQQSLFTKLNGGVFGLSNASLDTSWPKLTRTREAVKNTLLSSTSPSVDALFDIFADQTRAPDDALPKTGLSLEKEQALSSPFIVDPVYGTRSTSILLKDHVGQIQFLERSFTPQGELFVQKSWKLDTGNGTIQYNP
jgi:uncharacterized protein with NRDE domain